MTECGNGITERTVTIGLLFIFEEFNDSLLHRMNNGHKVRLV